MAVTTPAIWYANYGNGSSTGYFAVTAWHQPWTPTVGTITRQTAPSVGVQRCFVCTTSGAVGGTEPTWVTTIGAKTTDSSAIWFECTGQPSLNGDLTSTPLSSQNRSGAQTVGNIITNNTQDHYFICTVAGSTGAGEPTFTTTTGGTTVDSGCTWTCLGAVSSFTTAWAAPFAYLTSAGSIRMNSATVQTLYVSAAHAESASSGTTTTIGTSGSAAPPNQVICVSNTPSLPPVAADITTGATVTFGSGFFTVQGNVEFNGIAFFTTGGITPTWGNATGSFVRIRNGSLSFTGNGNNIKFAFIGVVEMINTTMVFGTTSGQGVSVEGIWTWRDTASALSASTWPTTFISTATAFTCLFEGVDLSAFAGTQLFTSAASTSGRFVISHCKLGSNTLMTAPASPGPWYDVINCDTGGNTYMTQRYTYGMIQSVVTNVVPTSGSASDGTTAYAWSLLGGASTLSWTSAFECMPICIWNTVTASNVTVTIQAAYVGTALPYNDQLWVDVRYFGTVSSTATSVASSTKATILTTHTQWSASSILWGASAAARQNSHAYVLGDAIGISSGSSIVRAFVCTTAGTSSGSLPGAYGTAVDGTQVTDGSAVFTAVVRFALTLTLSAPQPQEAGYLLCYVKCGLSNSSSYPTFFVNPSVALS